MRRKIVKALTSVLAVVGITASLSLVSGPAMAADNDNQDRAAAALTVYERVAAAPDPTAAIEALSPADHDLFVYAVTPYKNVVVRTVPAQPNNTALNSCDAMTEHGQGKSAAGVALYDFWTTGRICWDANGVSSATYLDGGGYSGALGWSYTGSTHAQGIVSGWGYAVGRHYFELNIAGIIVQSPVGCARVIGSTGALFGDVGNCSLG